MSDTVTSPLAALGGGTVTDPKPAPVVEAAASLDAWKANKSHLITLVSGTKVRIALPDLPLLVKNDVIPNELVDVAIGVASGEKQITKDDIIKQSDFYNQLVALTVIEPKVTVEEVAADVLPYEDKDMLVEFATRQRDMDAVGHHLAGLEKVRDWRTFRGLGHIYEDMENA